MSCFSGLWNWFWGQAMLVAALCLLAEIGARMCFARTVFRMLTQTLRWGEFGHVCAFGLSTHGMLSLQVIDWDFGEVAA